MEQGGTDFQHALSAHKEGDYQKAASQYYHVIEEEPENDRAHYNLGLVLKKLERYEEAEDRYRKALEINAEYHKAHNDLGIVLEKLDRYEEAEYHYRKAFEIDPENDKAHNNLGLLLKNSGRYEEAENHYRKALEINAENSAAHNNLGLLLKNSGRYEEAEDHYREALEIDPEYFLAHNNLGVLLENLERYEEAETHYRKALEIDPENDKAYNNLGVVLKNIGRDEEAEDYYRKAFEINPENSAAHNNLGLLLESSDRYEEAEDHYRKALEINPEYSDAHNNLGAVLEKVGRYEEAEDHYRKALEIDPENSAAEENLSQLQEHREQPSARNERRASDQIPDEIPRTPTVSVDYGTLTEQGPIGGGGNADVVKIIPADRDVTLAIKEPRLSGTLHADQVERMLREAETWDKLDDHDHVVGIVDYGSEPLPWIAMEYMDAGHLGERSGEMHLPQALWTAIAVTKGVRHAHIRGVAHLDLKPENILFRTVEDAWDVPKVADWGLSKYLLEHSKSIDGMSPRYAAPEQFDEGYGPTDNRTDIYQLGAVFYELFTGQPPFKGRPAQVMRAVLDEHPTPPSEIADVPEALDEVLLTALAKEKADRYEDVLLFRNALQDLFDDY